MEHIPDKHVIKLTSRQWFFACLVAVVAILLAAAYFQFKLGYEPCPLCELQRIMFLLEAIVLFVAVIHNPKKMGIRIYSGIVILVAIIGAIFSGRQVWLQSLPAGKAPACGPNFNFIVAHLPPSDALHQIFYGNASCAKVDWSFLHMSFAGWALVFFSLVGLVALWQLSQPKYK